jgi:hypothetical protein
MSDHDILGWKKFHDCLEDPYEAFRAGREPKIFPQCIAPVLKTKQTDLKEIHSNDTGSMATKSEIRIGEMFTLSGVRCIAAESPLKQVPYLAERDICASVFDKMLDDREESGPNLGIHWSVSREKAWNSYAHETHTPKCFSGLYQYFRYSEQLPNF